MHINEYMLSVFIKLVSRNQINVGYILQSFMIIHIITIWNDTEIYGKIVICENNFLFEYLYQRLYNFEENTHIMVIICINYACIPTFSTSNGNHTSDKF